MNPIDYSISEIEQIIGKGEDSKTQFKSRFASIDSLAVEISAMANSHGGIIVIGVSDTGQVLGIEDLNKLNQWISNACSQKIDPPLSVATQNCFVDEKLLVLLEIPIGMNKPYAANKGELWVKVGADKRRATREELKRLMQASGNLYADEMPVASTSLPDIDMFTFRRFYEEEYGLRIDDESPSIETALNNLKLMAGDTLTLSGLLLFGEKPEMIRPQFIVKAISFIGDSVGGNEYIDSEDIAGPLPADLSG